MNKTKKKMPKWLKYTTLATVMLVSVCAIVSALFFLLSLKYGWALISFILAVCAFVMMIVTPASWCDETNEFGQFYEDWFGNGRRNNG